MSYRKFLWGSHKTIPEEHAVNVRAVLCKISNFVGLSNPMELSLLREAHIMQWDRVTRMAQNPPMGVNSTSGNTSTSEIGSRVFSTEYYKSPLLDQVKVTAEVENEGGGSLGSVNLTPETLILDDAFREEEAVTPNPGTRPRQKGADTFDTFIADPVGPLVGGDLSSVVSALGLTATPENPRRGHYGDILPPEEEIPGIRQSSNLDLECMEAGYDSDGSIGPFFDAVLGEIDGPEYSEDEQEYHDVDVLYASATVGGASTVMEVVPVGFVFMSKDEIMKMTTSALKEELGKRGLTKYGLKKDLIDRMIDAIDRCV